MRVRVPASSANLGPGFDTLGVALGLYLTCSFERADSLTISARGRDVEKISTATDNLIWQTALAVANEVGESMPPLKIDIDNDIPLGKGLGSSAAALVAGVAIADHLLGLHWKPPLILDMAARLEGHPDNVAACTLGSVVASATDSGGVARAVRIDFPTHYALAVVVPDFVLPTKDSRRVLPDCYSSQDAIFNLQRSALLVAALATGATSAFPAAFEDRIHQPYRCPLVPGLEQIIRLRAPGLLGCTLSGAGPSVLVFYEKGSEQVCDLVCQIFAANGRRSETLQVQVADHGYQLFE